MKKSMLVLLGMLLSSGVLGAGCSKESTQQQAKYVVGAANATVIQGGVLKASSIVDYRVPQMTGISENDNLRLFIDEKMGTIAVINKQSGNIWYSNPVNRETDSIETGINKEKLSAQVEINYYNLLGQINTINSFTDSVNVKQMKIESIPNGARVSYRFGTEKKTVDDMPMKISKQRFEDKLFNKVDKTAQRSLKIGYVEDKEASVYVRNDKALNGLQLKRILDAFEAAGYTEKDLAADIEENNLQQTKPEPRIFNLSVEYYLDDDNLVVKVPVSSITYPEDSPVNSISFLNYFGAGGKEDQGSIFVPDGSGALINYNNGKTQYAAYQQPVYGLDLALNSSDFRERDQQIRLPVYGMIRNGEAFLGIIEEGAAAATINADTSGRLNSYNYVYPSFNVINKDDVTLIAKDAKRSLPMFQQEPMKSDFCVRYAFLSGDSASYEGMAHYYQKYLIERGGLPKRNELNSQDIPDIPFYLQLIGSIPKKKYFLGIPYHSLEPLTTFEEAKTIIAELKQEGINEIKLKYTGWFNKGIDHQAPKHISIDSVLGGRKGFSEFVAFANHEGVSLYPDIALLQVYQPSGFKQSKEASRMLSDAPAIVYPMNQALNRRDRDRNPSYVLSPSQVDTYVDRMLSDYKVLQTKGVSLRDLADRLNSDFRKNHLVDRTESEKISVNAFDSLNKAQLKMMANGGNAYSLPYLTDITNVPLSSSKFKIEDEEVPFYQMVVHGFVNYTGSPYNLSTYTNDSQYILKSLEYAANVNFEWIYQPNYKLKDTQYDYLYSVNYMQWIDQAVQIYKNVNEVLKKVQHLRMISHEELNDGVFKTTFEDGSFIIVNYNRSQVEINGMVIAAESYYTGGGKS